MDALLTWVYRGLRPLQPPVLLPVVRAAQRVNDEPVKVLNWLFYVYFFRNLAETFKKLQFLTFGPKQCSYLTHSATEYFEKLALIKKTKKRNFKRLYLKSQREFRVKTKIFRKFFQFSSKKRCFCTLYPRGYTGGGSAPYKYRCCCQWLVGLKELMMNQ